MAYDLNGLYYLSVATNPSMNKLMNIAKLNIPKCSHVWHCVNPINDVRIAVINSGINVSDFILLIV